MLHPFLVLLQGVIHWVAEPSPGFEPLKVVVRHFDKLFKSEVRSHQLYLSVMNRLSLPSVLTIQFIFLPLPFNHEEVLQP